MEHDKSRLDNKPIFEKMKRSSIPSPFLGGVTEDRSQDIGENPAYDKSEYLIETFFSIWDIQKYTKTLLLKSYL